MVGDNEETSEKLTSGALADRPFSSPMLYEINCFPRRDESVHGQGFRHLNARPDLLLANMAALIGD
jgi:hypothetical protein